jgi:MFS family permease
VLANVALALLSAALTAALFLLVLLLVDGWRNSPAVAALTVTAVPVASMLAGPLFRHVRAGTRSEAVAGSGLIAGGLAGLALLPSAELAWTLAPQMLVGFGLGLSIDSLTAAALRDRLPRAVHGGWTIAARHAGVVVGLAILTPIFTADLRHAETPAKEAIASLVLDAPLPASTKLDLAAGLGRRLAAERGRVPDLRPAFKNLRVPATQAMAATTLEARLEDQLGRAATRAFRTAFLVAAGLALLALGPALALRDRSRS